MSEPVPAIVKEIVKYLGPELAELVSAGINWSGGVAMEELAVFAVKKRVGSGFSQFAR